MKELEILVDDLKKYFAKKELELRSNKNFNSHTEGYLFNRQRDIESFQSSCENCDKNPLLKTQIIVNFNNVSDKIKSELDEISC